MSAGLMESEAIQEGFLLRKEEKEAGLCYKSWKRVLSTDSGYVEEQRGFFRLSVYDAGDVWPVRPMEDVFGIRMDGPHYFRSIEECEAYLKSWVPSP